MLVFDISPSLFNQTNQKYYEPFYFAFVHYQKSLQWCINWLDRKLYNVYNITTWHSVGTQKLVMASKWL